MMARRLVRWRAAPTGHVRDRLLVISYSPAQVSPDKMRLISGFVHQEDVILATMTVGDSGGAVCVAVWAKGACVCVCQPAHAARALAGTAAPRAWFGQAALPPLLG